MHFSLSHVEIQFIFSLKVSFWGLLLVLILLSIEFIYLLWKCLIIMYFTSKLKFELEKNDKQNSNQVNPTENKVKEQITLILNKIVPNKYSKTNFFASTCPPLIVSPGNIERIKLAFENMNLTQLYIIILIVILLFLPIFNFFMLFDNFEFSAAQYSQDLINFLSCSLFLKIFFLTILDISICLWNFLSIKKISNKIRITLLG